MAVTIAELIVKVTGDPSGALGALALTDRAMAETAGGAGVLGAKTQAIGMGVAALGAGIGLFLGDALKQSITYDKMLQTIHGNTTMTTADMHTMSSTVTTVATSTGASVDRLAEGYMRIVNLNYQGAGAQSVLMAATRSSIATNAELGDTVNVLTSVMREFNMTADQASVTMDLMHNAAQHGNMTLDEFVAAGRPAIGVAANLGDSLADVSAVYADLTTHGYSASRAATQLTGIFSHIIHPSKAATEEIAKLSKATGVDLVHDFGEFGQAAIGKKGVIGILDDLHKAIGDNTSEIFNIIPAIRGGTGAMALLGMGYEDLHRIMDSQSDVMNGKYTPSLDNFGQMEQTAGQKALILKENFDAAMRSIGSTMQGSFITVVTGLTTMVRAFNALPDSMKASIVVALEVASALMVVGGLVLIFGPLLAGLVSPVGLIIAAFLALGAAVVTNFMGLGDVAVGVWGAITQAAQNAWAFLQPIFTAMGKVLDQAVIPFFKDAAYWGGVVLGSALQVLHDAMAPLGGVFSSTGNALKPLYQIFDQFFATINAGEPVMLAFSDLSTNLFNLIQSVAPGVAAALLNLGRVFEPIMTAFAQFGATLAAGESLGTALSDLFKNLAPAVGPALGGLFDLLMATGKQLWAWIAPQIGPTVAKLWEWTQAAGNWLLHTGLPWLWNTTVSLGTALWNWVSPQVPKVLAQLWIWAQAAGNWLLHTGLPWLWNNAVALGTALWRWVAPQIPHVLAQLWTWAQAVGNWLLNTALPFVWSHLVQWGKALWGWVSPQIPVLLSKLGELGTHVWNWITDTALPAIISKIKEWGKAFVDWIGPATKDFLAKWPTFLDQFLTWIEESTGPILKQLGDWGMAFVKWVIPHIPDMLAALGGILVAIGAFIIESIPVIVRHLVKWAEAFWKWVEPYLPQIKAALDKMLGRIGSWIKDEAWPVIVTKLKEWGKAFGDWVKDTAWPWLVTKLKELATALWNWITQEALPGIRDKIKEWAHAFADWVTDSAIPWAKAKLFEFANAIWTWASQTAKDAVGKVTAIGKSIVDGIWAGISGAWQGFLKNLGGLVDGIATFVSAHIQHKSPAAKFIPIGESIPQGLAVGVDKGTNVLLESIQKMADAITKGVQAIGTLGTFAVPANFNSKLAEFSRTARQAVNQFGKDAGAFSEDFLKHASLYLDAANKGMELLGKGAEVMTKMKDLSIPSGKAMDAFMAGLDALLARLKARMGGWTAEMVAQATLFGDGSGKLLEGVAKGADLLTKLVDFIRPSDASIDAFIDGFQYLVSRLKRVMGGWNSDLDAQAKLFGDGTGKLLEGVGKGVEVLLKLKDFVKPSDAAIIAFVDSLMYLVDRLRKVVGGWTAEMDHDAKLFGDGSSKLLEGTLKGVETLLKLGDFKKPTDAAINAFVDGLQYLIDRLRRITSGWSKELDAQAKLFGDGSSKLLEGTVKGIETLSKLVDFVKPTDAKMDAFVDGFQYMVEKLRTRMAGWDATAVAAATLFGDGSSKLVDGAVKGAETLNKLVDFVKPSDAAMDAFVDGFQYLIEKLRTRMAGWNKEAVETATLFGDASSKLLEGVVKGVEALGKLGDKTFKLPTTEGIDSFFIQLDEIVRALRIKLPQWKDVLGKAEGELGVVLGQLLDGVTKGLDAIGKLATLKIPPGAIDVVDTFFVVLDEVLRAFSLKSAEWKGRATEEAAKIAVNLGTVAESLGKAVDGIVKILGFKADQPGFMSILVINPTRALVGIDGFFTALDMVITEFSRRASTWAVKATPEVAAVATIIGTVMDGISKAVDVVAKVLDFKSGGTSGGGLAGGLVNGSFQIVITGMVNGISGFFDALDRIVDMFVADAKRNGPKITEDVLDYAEKIGKLFTGIRGAVDMLVGMDKTKAGSLAEEIAKAFDKGNVDSLLYGWNHGLDDMFQHTMIWAAKLLHEQFRPLFASLTTMFENEPANWAEHYNSALQSMIDKTQELINKIRELQGLGGGTGNNGTPPPGTQLLNPASPNQGTTVHYHDSVIIQDKMVAVAPQATHDMLVSVGRAQAYKNPGALTMGVTS